MPFAPRRAVPIVLPTPIIPAVALAEGARAPVMPLSLLPIVALPVGATLPDGAGSETAVVLYAPIALEYEVEALIP